MNKNFINALNKTSQATPPIWCMRQAGRYHKHYQNLRARHSFMELCLIPELAAQVAMGPIEDFDFDVAILFSDLLFPLKALGMGLEYTEQGPKLGMHLNAQNISQLKSWQEALPELEFQKLALQATRSSLSKDKSLIGFVGGPWTLFCYAVQGSHQGKMIPSKQNPKLLREFEKILLPLLQANIQLQIEGGAEVVMIFDTAAGECSPAYFREHIEPSLLQLISKFPKRLGYYSKSTNKEYFSSNFIQESWAGFGFDHHVEMKDVLRWQKKGFSQGNFDQELLHLSASDFEQELKSYLRPLLDLTPDERAGWVCGLGHGVLPATPENNVRRFVQAVREAFQ